MRDVFACVFAVIVDYRRAPGVEVDRFRLVGGGDDVILTVYPATSSNVSNSIDATVQ